MLTARRQCKEKQGTCQAGFVQNLLGPVLANVGQELGCTVVAAMRSLIIEAQTGPITKHVSPERRQGLV